MQDRRRGLSIFRAADAPTLAETGMMATADMRPGVAEQLANDISAFDRGYDIRVLYGQPDDDGSPSLVYAWFKPNYPLPRHTHDADCLYYVVAGSAMLGNQVLNAGTGVRHPGHRGRSRALAGDDRDGARERGVVEPARGAARALTAVHRHDELVRAMTRATRRGG
jgi:hypothetical protein